jgi:hypothetical protein
MTNVSQPVKNNVFDDLDFNKDYQHGVNLIIKSGSSWMDDAIEKTKSPDQMKDYINSLGLKKASKKRVLLSVKNYTAKQRDTSIVVVIGNLTIWFSYELPIAFLYKGKLEIRQNEKGRKIVKGLHLNQISRNKKLRISGIQFEKKLDSLLKNLGLLD